MKKIKLLVMSVVLTTSLLISTGVYAQNNINVQRLSGKDRYETSNTIISKGWKGHDYAILVNSQMFADAITSAPLAKRYEAPILLTEGSSLTDSTKQKIQELKIKSIFIIGGTGVVSSNIENQLKDMHINIKRIYGQDRYETSVNVAKKLGVIEGAFVTTGEHWEDALAVAPIAAKLKYPILLVSSNNIPDTIKNYLNKIKSDNGEINIIGGNDVLTNNISNILNPTKIYNQATKYDRNLALINDYKDKLNVNNVFLASDSTFADALSGSALAAKNDNPIILVGDSNKGTVNNFIRNGLINVDNVTVLGGTGVLSDDTINTVINGGNNIPVSKSTNDQTTTPISISPITPNSNTTIGLNQKVTVPNTLFGTYEITINDVELTSERNQFNDSNPAEVYKINYTYKLLSKGSADMGLFLFDPFGSVDSTGEAGYGYPNTTNNDPKELKIIGSRCTADTFIGVNNKTTSLTLTLDYNTQEGSSYVTFNIPTK